MFFIGLPSIISRTQPCTYIHTHTHTHTHSTSHSSRRTVQLPATVKLKWAEPTLMHLLQLLSSGNISMSKLQQLLPPPQFPPITNKPFVHYVDLLYCNRIDFHYFLALNTRRPIQDVLSSEKTVYVGDVTLNCAAFSSAINYGCGLLFLCLISPFIWIRPPSVAFQRDLWEQMNGLQVLIRIEQALH